MSTSVAERILRLLRLAESTTFPAEAAECRRKAAELGARHGISDYVLRMAAAEQARREGPRARPTPQPGSRPMTGFVVLFNGMPVVINGGWTYVGNGSTASTTWFMWGR